MSQEIKKFKHSSLGMAVKAGAIEDMQGMYDILLKGGQYNNEDVKQSELDKMVHIAIINDQLPAAQMVLGWGGRLPQHYEAMYELLERSKDNQERLAWLLDNGANITMLDSNGYHLGYNILQDAMSAEDEDDFAKKCDMLTWFLGRNPGVVNTIALSGRNLGHHLACQAQLHSEEEEAPERVTHLAELLAQQGMSFAVTDIRKCTAEEYVPAEDQVENQEMVDAWNKVYELMAVYRVRPPVPITTAPFADNSPLRSQMKDPAAIVDTPKIGRAAP